MVKVKAVLPMESPLCENPRAMFKHQSLLQDYGELQRETKDLKRKLLMMQQKKSSLLAEVRFLRRRYQYLTKNTPFERKPNLMVAQPRRSDDQRAGKKPKDMPTQADSNHKRRGSKASSNEKRATFENPATICNLIQNEEVCGRKEGDNKSGTPILDLNLISREEEELQSSYEPSKTIKESYVSILRVSNNGCQDDVKILSCRKIESGPNGVKKRKITWQDQVALGVSLIL